MALTDGRWWVELEYADKQGREGIGRKRFQIVAVDYAAAVIVRDAIATAWPGISNASILKIYTYQERYENAYTPDSSDGERENKIKWTWQVENPLKGPTTTTPAPVEGVLLALSGPNNNILDLTDAAVLAWETLYTDGTVLLSDGETVTDLTKGIRIHHASRKQRGSRRG